jgi:cytoskeleton protein RodZ
MAENEQLGEDSEFGAELRKQREIRGISLKEIADSTKISKRFLEALEKNDFRILPAPVFTRGFVREYARYLGLNAEEMVSRYGLIVQRMEEAEKLAVPGGPPPPPRLTATQPPPPVEQRRGLSGGVMALIGAVIVAAIAIGAFFLLRGRETSTDAATVVDSTPSANEQAPGMQLTTASSTDPAPPATGLQMTMKLVEDSWITMEIDGERTVNDELKSGSERSFTAKEKIVFRTIGNAAALRLTINGVTLPPLGDSGDVVRNRTFDRNTIEELQKANP